MSGEHGAAAVLVAALCCVAVTMALVVGSIGQVLTAAGRARAAADAAALAAAPMTFDPEAGPTAPTAEAHRFARANGADLVACSCPRDPSFRTRTVSVIVEVGVRTALFGTHRVRASSRARFTPTTLHPDVGQPPSIPGPEPLRQPQR